MGAWGHGSFENDNAGDWLYNLEESSNTSVIKDALDKIVETGDEYLEAPDCCNAIAAAEIIAALCGHPVAKFPDNAEQWVKANSALSVDDLVPPALATLERIRTNSELKELLEESEDATAWYAAIDDLTKRLNG